MNTIPAAYATRSEKKLLSENLKAMREIHDEEKQKLSNTRRREAINVIQSYRSFLADPLRLATMSDPEEAVVDITAACKRLMKQYDISEEELSTSENSEINDPFEAAAASA